MFHILFNLRKNKHRTLYFKKKIPQLLHYNSGELNLKLLDCKCKIIVIQPKTYLLFFYLIQCTWLYWDGLKKKINPIHIRRFKKFTI